MRPTCDFEWKDGINFDFKSQNQKRVIYCLIPTFWSFFQQSPNNFFTKKPKILGKVFKLVLFTSCSISAGVQGKKRAEQSQVSIDHEFTTQTELRTRKLQASTDHRSSIDRRQASEIEIIDQFLTSSVPHSSLPHSSNPRFLQAPSIIDLITDQNRGVAVSISSSFLNQSSEKG
ncbi:hypothetical protein LXL04_015741 [Taraxacum kok-saghyz]